MTASAWILDLEALAALTPPALRLESILQLGRLASGMNDAATFPDTRTDRLPASHREEYDCHMAREWLLARQSGMSAPVRDAQRLAHVRPFGHGPSCAELEGLHMAAAVVPLGTEQGGPGVAQIWIVRDPEDRLAGHARHEPRGSAEVFAGAAGFRIFTVSSAGRELDGFDGLSWQLAGRLALRSLREGPRQATVLELASRWIVSGCDGGAGRVGRVGLGNKLLLCTDRDWMLPSENRGDIPDNWHPPGARRLAPNEEAAWSLVSGKGTREGSMEPWPRGITALHSLVSGAWPPVVAAALFSGANRMTLWHTDNEDVSRSRAYALRDIVFPGLKSAGIDVPEIGDPQLITSTDLAKAERTLRPVVEKDLRAGGTVLFNITNGNRLMALAPHNLARRHPSLCLIYRDIDEKGLDFTAIRYDDFEPTTFTLRAEQPPHHDKLDWDALLAPPMAKKNAQPDWNAELEKILRQLPENPKRDGFLIGR